MNVICKHCGSNIMVKDGKIAGKQRWKCTKCHKTTREGDGRNKYPLWKKILAIKLHREGKSLNEISRLVEAPRAMILYWLRNYEKIMKNEMKSLSFPKDSKNIMLIEQKNFKQLRDNFGFDQAFGIICTNSKSDVKTIVFVME